MSLVLQLKTSLIEDDTEANRRQWAQHIILNAIPLEQLLEIALDEKKVAMRFLWLMGGICDLKPEVVAPCVPYFFANRHRIKVPNYERSLAKFLALAGIPEVLEGEAGVELFGWLSDPKTIVTTKTYAMQALFELSQKHPDLWNELKLVIEDQLEKNSVSFRAKAKKILKVLDGRK